MRRGTVLFAVVVALALGALVVVGLLSRAVSRVEESRARLDQLQARTLAQSGLDAVLVEFASQRGELLAGAEPVLTAEWSVPLGAGGGMGGGAGGGPGGVTTWGRVRLIPVSGAGDGDGAGEVDDAAGGDGARVGGLAMSEAAKLDAGALPREVLARALGAGAADRIVAARGPRGDRLASVGEVLERGGLAMGQVVEPRAAGDERGAGEATTAEVTSGDNVFERRRAAGVARAGEATGEAALPGARVEDLLTVFAFDAIGLAPRRGDRETGELAVIDSPGRVEPEDADRFTRAVRAALDGVLDGGAGEDAGEDARDEAREDSRDARAAGDGDADRPESLIARRRGEGEGSRAGGRAGARGAGRDVGAMLATAFAREKPPKSTAELVRALRAASVPPSAWKVAWAVRFEDDLFARGRVDVTRASALVLSVLPGFDAEIAAEVVERRGSLSSERLSDPTWLVQEELLTPEAFEAAADWIAVRSLVWRVRIEAEVLDGGMDGASSDGEPTRRARVVLDAVIDAADSRVRVAYVRDASLDDALARVARAARSGARDAEEAGLDQVRDDLRGADEVAAGEADGGGADGGRRASGDEARSRADRRRSETRGAEGRGDRRGSRSAAADRAGADDEPRDGTGDGDGSDAGGSGEAGGAGGAGLGRRDNRIGRWKGGGG
jgi:hypothetical protein